MNIVGRIMDKAQAASREALFAALQAAIGAVIDAQHGRLREDALEHIEKRLDLGVPYGADYLTEEDTDGR